MKLPPQNDVALISAIILLGPTPLLAGASATVSIRADQPGPVVSSNLFGIFFEEINYAGEGGLYAEMVRNRRKLLLNPPRSAASLLPPESKRRRTADPPETVRRQKNAASQVNYQDARLVGEEKFPDSPT